MLQTAPAVLPTRRNSRKTALGSPRLKLVFMLPAAVLFSVVMLVPIALNLVYAFTNWDGYGAAFDFIGLNNFVRIFSDSQTRTAFINTIVFTAINAPLQIGLGLGLALALQRPGKFVAFLRLVIVFPIAVSGVVLGFLGNVIFDPSTGILQAASAAPGLGWLGQNWLGSPQLAMGSVIAMNLWQWSGYTMLIFLAGLSTIPGELYEAAKLDGAGRLGQFRYVSWPLLAPAATINIVLTIIGGLKVFDIIYVLTGGGPGNATESVVMRVASQGSYSSFGYSSAISFTLTVVILIVAVALIIVLRKREINS